MDRIVLHSDCNCFYASVECLYHPELRDKPVAVGGDEKKRHGIILTKNYIAKKYGIKTGETLWQARLKCPDLVIIPPDFKKYMRFSKMTREIYLEFTNLVEPFGLDEAWLDCTASKDIFGGGMETAEKIRRKIKKELGITVSIGVSWNKIYAKLGSDYKKPDAVTVFDRENYKKLVFPQPAENMLYVGRANKRRLALLNIRTIGDIAKADREFLHKHFGKWGYVLHSFANGYDIDPVREYNSHVGIKSIGNSFTLPRDLNTNGEVFAALALLSESVGARLREHGLKGSVVSVSVRDNGLFSFERQKKLKLSTDINDEILKAAYELFILNYNWQKPIRSLGVRVSDLAENTEAIQMDIFGTDLKREKHRNLDKSLDSIRNRFGPKAVVRGTELINGDITAISPKTDNVIFPTAYFK